MLNLKTIAAATALASVIAFAPAQAQFVGGPSNVTTVKNLLDSGKDDQLATLEGYIVQQVKLCDCWEALAVMEYLDVGYDVGNRFEIDEYEC